MSTITNVSVQDSDTDSGNHRRWVVRALRSAGWSLGLLLAACEFGARTSIDTSGTIVPVGDNVTSERLGIGGGSVTTPAGVSLTVPAGALGSEQLVSVVTLDSDGEDLPDGLDEDERTAVTIDSGGRPFQSPVQISFDRGPIASTGNDEFSVALFCLVTPSEDSDGAELLSNQRTTVNTQTGRVSTSGDVLSPFDRLTTVHVAELSDSPISLDVEGFVSQLDVSDPPQPLDLEIVGDNIFIDRVQFSATASGPLTVDPATGNFSSSTADTTSPRHRGTLLLDCSAAGAGQLDVEFSISVRPVPGEESVFPPGGVTKTLQFVNPVECTDSNSGSGGEPPQAALNRQFLQCSDRSQCGGLDQFSLFQDFSGNGFLAPWDPADAGTGCDANGVCTAAAEAPVSFGPFAPEHIALLASGDGPISAIRLATGERLGQFLGGQDTFFGSNRHFQPLGVLPVVPDIEGGSDAATLVSYGRALDGSTTAGRIQRYAPPPGGDANDFGRDFSHITGNTFFLDATSWGGATRSNGGILSSDSGLRLFRFNPDPNVFAYNTFRFVDIGPVLSAYSANDDPDNPGPALALQDSALDGPLLQHVDLNTAAVTTVGSVGVGPRQLRCLNGICAASHSGLAEQFPSGVSWFAWDGVSAQVTALGSVELGVASPYAQVIGLDMVAFDNGNIGILTVGFNNNTVYEIAIDAAGGLLQQHATLTDGACQNPGHGRWTADQAGLVWVVSCFNGDGVQVGQSKLGLVAP